VFVKTHSDEKCIYLFRVRAGKKDVILIFIRFRIVFCFCSVFVFKNVENANGV
jgi:hypothetical protein